VLLETFRHVPHVDATQFLADVDAPLDQDIEPQE
jgi:hypothetical protein